MNALILDFYDDARGEVLTAMIPDKSLLPDFVKTASQVSRGGHPNQFAVVMVDGDQVHPRYPITDPGNTWLSSLYFHAQHDQLSGEVQKVAAVRIKQAMEAFGMGNGIPDSIEKLAEGETAQHHIVDISDRQPQAVDVHPADDAREAAMYALEDGDGNGIYELNNAADAATAAQYFDTHRHEFTTRERREYAVKTASVLDKAGLPIPQSIADYSGEGFSPNLKAFLDVRGAWVIDMDDPEISSHFQKVAASRGTVDPETFAQNLEKFDRDVGLDQLWNRGIPDPYYSTFYTHGGFKTKTAAAVGASEMLQAGSELVSDVDVVNLAREGKAILAQAFDTSVVASFCKDPVAVFKSMPLPQRQILARLASDLRSS